MAAPPAPQRWAEVEVGMGRRCQCGVPVWAPGRASGPGSLSAAPPRINSSDPGGCAQIFDTQKHRYHHPLRGVLGSGKLGGGQGEKRALLYLEAISRCVSLRVLEVGSLHGPLSDRQEKVVVLSQPPTRFSS